MKGIFILICVVVGFASCTSMFFDTPTRLKPNIYNKSDFGFSMGFQNSTVPYLVVGAPRFDTLGTVFNCPLSDVSKDITCSEVPKKKFIPPMNYKQSEQLRESINPSQHFFLGSTILATAKDFLTCAPMFIKRIGGTDDTYGTCYWHDETDTYTQFKDNGVKIRKLYSMSLKSKDIAGGGLGWNSLLDEEHGRLLIAKTAIPGDITYIDINEPLGISKSLYEGYDVNIRQKFEDFWNLGYGLAVGHFFDKNTYLYAVSYRNSNLRGSILFLNEIQNRDLNIMLNPDVSYTINNEDLGTMFGYALAAADFNGDGLSELIVGAPAQTDDTKKWEPGALHIFVGGPLLSRNDKSRMRTILGTQYGGRFGSAIATNDIDGDNIPEIFVSAPYQYSETGVVYVISGYDIKKTLFAKNGFKRISLSELKLTQELRSIDSRHLGISLQVVPDVDQNGCNDIAIGSPASNMVLLYRCLPSVTAKIRLEQLGDKIVKEDAKNVDIKVCVDIKVNEKALKKQVQGKILVTNSVNNRHTKVSESEFSFDLSHTHFCRTITVNFLKSEQNDYTFKTQLKLVHDSRTNDYNQRAVLSPSSDPHKTIKISRLCNTTEECNPDFKLNAHWLTGDKVYDFQSKTVETMKLSVLNDGHDAMAKLELIISGSRVSSTTNQCVRSGHHGYLVNHYSCSIPKVMRRGEPYDIIISLNKTEPTNAASLNVSAMVHSPLGGSRLEYTKPVKLDTKPVQIDGTCHDFNVTDKDLANKGLSKYTDTHEYHIHNNGPVTWVNLTAELTIEKQPFIEHVELITIETCTEVTGDKLEYYKFYCALNLKPYSSARIVPSIDISKEKIGQALAAASGKVNTNSILSLLLQPTNDVRHKSLTTTTSFQKILTVGNNFTMILTIGIIVALIIILALAFILYKCGFFKRAEKKQLETLRESIRKRNEKRESGIPVANENQGGSSNVNRKSQEEEVQNDIEMFDENDDFTPSPHSSKDDTKLIKGKHVENKIC